MLEWGKKITYGKMAYKFNKKLTVIIINFNTPEYLKNCVKSLFAYRPKVDFDALIVDNNSRDKSVENIVEQFPCVQVIRNRKNLGFATANNIAIRQILSKYILLLNSDTIVLPGSVDSMVDTMEARPSAGILGCQLLNPDGRFQESFSRFPGLINEFLRKSCYNSRLYLEKGILKNLLFQIPDRVREVDWVSGACMLLRKCAVKESGLFDENYFMYFEDVDFCLRMKRSGWGVEHTPMANVVHYGGASARQDLEMVQEEYRKSQLYFYSKHNSSLSNFGLKAYLYLKNLRGSLNTGAPRESALGMNTKLKVE